MLDMMCLWKLFWFIINILAIFKLCLCFRECDKGFFMIEDMQECHPWLKCQEIDRMNIGDLLGFGAVKQVYKSSWKNYTVAYVYINNNVFLDDFIEGLDFLRTIGPNSYTVQLLGFCVDSYVYVTEYYPLGNCLNIQEVITQQNVTSLRKRFQLCIDYVRILEFLHNSPLGRRVMCDSNTLNKTLEQYLLTSSLSLILNDVDALPKVGKEGVLCGHKEIHGSFVAPEQKWPYKDREFLEQDMPHYNEKIDIWKIPAVCNHFLGKSEAAQLFHYHIYSIHQKCRQRNPLNRPSAKEVLRFYENVMNKYFIEQDAINKEEL